MQYNMFGMHEKSLALIERVRPFLPGDESILFSEANTWMSMGRASKAIPIYDGILADQPHMAPTRSMLSVTLLQTGQYERLVKDGLPWAKVLGLTVLERNEEATLLAEKIAVDGNVIPLMFLLSRTRQVERLVELFELRWADLDAFEADYPADGYGYALMLIMAQAFAKTDNEGRTLDALKRVRRAQDKSVNQGIVSGFFKLHEARYYALLGDHEEAINYLEQAADLNAMLARPLAGIWAEFEDLRGDPRFEAAQARILENVNRERAELDLDSLEL
jgi:tetratricopeptide (TPR) repeat protein